MNTPGKKIGVALSGGGYRAAAFHLGTLRALDELNILQKVDRYSTVSGGSIVGADYLLSVADQKAYQEFEDSFKHKLKQSVIGQVLRSGTFLAIAAGILIWLGLICFLQFTNYYWISWVLFVAGLFVIIKCQFRIFPVSVIIEGIYDRIFFKGKKLNELPKEPMISINSTNLETGLPFVFSKTHMIDSTYSKNMSPAITFNAKDFPISRSVMASSSVPSVFTPVPITKEFFLNQADAERVWPMLVDGGIYDNQGTHKLMAEKSRYSCDIIIVSDAGNKMPFESQYGNAFTLLVRTVDLFMNRIKKVQIQNNIYQSHRNKDKDIAYISLGWDLANCIPGFISNLKDGNISDRIVSRLGIPPQFLNPTLDAEKVQQFIEQKMNYPALVQRMQQPEQLALARSVGTNLTSLSDAEIHALINQAEIMTLLQVQLYCL